MNGGSISSIDGDVYETPSPSLVARIVDSHGLDMACERWCWLGERTLSSLAQQGRAQAGRVPPPRAGGRSMSCSEAEAAVAIEAGYALGSAQRGIRAAGISVGSQGLYSRRGLTPPTISSTERGVATALGARARRGDAEAAAAWQARLDFERAVGSVVRRALALVPEQPVIGRYALPPSDAALAEALREEDPAAVAVVFPDLAALEPEPAEPEPEPPVTVTEPQPTLETRPMPRRRLMPTDNVIVAEHAQGKSAAQMAADWEVTPAAVYAHWRRLGLNRKPAPVAVVPPAPPPEPIRLPVTPMLSDGRLSVDDLARAMTLARREGITPDEAVRFVRADIDQARPPARPFVPDGPPAGFSTYRMPAKLEAWYQALADGLDLPELEMADFDV